MIKQNIITQTVQMLSPNVNAKKARTLFNINEKDNDLIDKEMYLRKHFYNYDFLKKEESFFNDTDMQSHYFLIVCYEEILNVPLLSSRYYYDKHAIKNTILGDKTHITFNRPYSLNWILNQHSFLLDRLSVNMNEELFHKNEGKVFSSLKKEFCTQNPNSILLFLAEMHNNDKNLNTYEFLGFKKIGATISKSIPYLILLNDLKNLDY